MPSKTISITEYLQSLPDDKRKAMEKLRSAIRKNLPKGFKEEMNYGMIGYVIPHTLYPKGYHCKPTDPLPFMNIAAQKNFMAVYHMGLYADPVLMKWFLSAYPEHCEGKPDMGKSCIRFKKPEQVPFALIGELASKMSPADWIRLYEKSFTK
jgi:hypothetical protein